MDDKTLGSPDVGIRVEMGLEGMGKVVETMEKCEEIPCVHHSDNGTKVLQKVYCMKSINGIA